MTSPRERAAELARFYTVTEPQRHPRGYTVYKVTARIVSRRNPEDVQEIVVWKRYSDFKKLHKDLWQIHKNLFRHTELFPPFAKAIVFGRFDETVIEERRQCAEDLLQFSANIPALYSSKHLEDFFKGGEVHDGSELIGPAEPYTDSLIDSFSDCSTEVRKDLSSLDDVTLTSQSEGGGFSSDSDLISLTVDVDSLAELDDGMASNQNSPSRTFGLSLSPEPSALAAVASDKERSKTEEERENRGLFAGSLKSRLGKKDYLEKAGELIKQALKKEEEEDYEAASSFYKRGVDLLLEGVQGESSPTRREAVKKRTAEYLMRAEQLSSFYLKPHLGDGASSQPPGSLSSRPSWNLRSPAEELKAFRVLGVIDKVLLVMDTRTQQTFILKGLRKSSEYSRNRKTIIPRCVPNMVCLHKYIISEESVFLVLQHAEGGKLWSYISRFLNRSSEESLDIQEVKKSTLAEVHLQQPTPSPKDSSSLESRGSDGGSMLKVLHLKTSLTPSSQEDSSNQEEDGQDGSPKWPDSGSSSEEECTTSYLTLCNEYGQEKIEPGSLNEEPLMKIKGNGVRTKATGSFPAHVAPSSDSLSSQLTSQELKFFIEDANREVASPPRISDSLSRSKNSPMAFFRIDSKDSTNELLGLDFGEKLYSLKSEPLKPFFALQDQDSSSGSLDASETRLGLRAQDTISRGSNDSVPVISFKDAAFDDVSSTDEGRPDLLVNLPGVLEPTKEAATEGPAQLTQTNIGILESKLLEAPDVLCLSLSTEPCQGLQEKDTEASNDPCSHQFHSIEEKHYAQEGTRALLIAAVDQTSSGDKSLLLSSDAEFKAFGMVAPTLTANSTEESLFLISNPVSGANEYNVNSDTLKREEVLLFADRAEDPGKEEPTPSLFQLDPKDTKAKGDSGLTLEGEKEIHQIFEDLDKKLALTSRFYIPEGCIQRWAAEMVVALDALHREGIVCRDLNPNNILLNDRGHIQLTYFSRWSEVEDSCDSDAIERMYCAPEVGAITEETEACDWWSLGAVLFELLTGKTLAECHPAGINTHTALNLPECISEEARSLIQQLLQFNPVERLGAGVAGVEDIKSHPFFTPVDWAELMR
ncbi:ribosomal protein S6 kinase delta-1 isoform X1 [Trichosurus vulpecula]|uniref:ribosomal protein S6 kinase delta-1 isoform X1 n=1 Tax=Trichosurus vulpecula TaxID=9337 RepID=UPI00186B4104|nr:ribosomal protein S6 kinase delta-1 isoform X1 [Trichosurus vulpecula]